MNGTRSAQTPSTLSRTGGSRGSIRPAASSRSSSPSLPWKRGSSLPRTRSSATAGIVSVPGIFDVGGRPGTARWICTRPSCSPAMSISTSWANVSVSSAFRPMRSGSASGRERESGWMGKKRVWFPPRSGKRKRFGEPWYKGENAHRLDRSGGPAGHSDPDCQHALRRDERGHPVRAETRREGRVHGRQGTTSRAPPHTVPLSACPAARPRSSRMHSAT